MRLATALMVAAAKLERDKALWDVQQTTIVSPVNAKVFDIIYRAGERPSAGKPIISLLPPENIKVRFLYPKRCSVNLKSDLR
jgi:HlyD family secretion protein